MIVLPDIAPIPDDPIVKLILNKVLKALKGLISQSDGAADANAQLALDAVQAMIDLNQIAGRAYFGASTMLPCPMHVHASHTHTPCCLPI
jgi:hypothetical protein